jgi:hypothetical protein
VVNDWRRFTVDFKYFLTRAVGIGAAYWSLEASIAIDVDFLAA